jgi:hypothetical protein
MGAVNAIRKKVKQRDDILLDYDKFKTQVIKYTGSPKEQVKLLEAEKKFEEQKEVYNKINSELIKEIQEIHDNRISNFWREFQLVNVNKCFQC